MAPAKYYLADFFPQRGLICKVTETSMEINLQLSGQNFILFDENIKCQNDALQYAYNCILSVCVCAAVYGEHVFIIGLELIGREWVRHVAD